MPFEIDAYSPDRIAERIETVGVRKAALPFLAMFLLAVLAGSFIAFGSLFATLVSADPALTPGVARPLAGLVFSLGLFLVVVAGAELFTGNNLLAMAWADGRISTGAMFANWVVVFLGNAVGAFGVALMVVLAHHPDLNGGAVGAQYVRIALAKAALSPQEAFFRGVLCNVLVCLAVWMSFAGRSVVDKLVAVVFPVAAFVAAGFEHSIANLYFLPVALLWRDRLAPGAVPGADRLDWSVLWTNLVPVTAGNILGGSVLVATVYFLVYRVALARRSVQDAPARDAEERGDDRADEMQRRVGERP